LPYKDLTSFHIEEPCVARWIHDLNPKSKSYVYYLIKYCEWFKARRYWKTTQEMLDEYRHLDEEGRIKHLERLEEYVRSKRTGVSDKRNAWHAVNSLYSYHRLPLPKIGRNEAGKVFKPSEEDTRRALELAPLQLEEVQKLILNAPMPYKAVFAVMFQGAMGLEEFNQFNRSTWRDAAKELDKPGPTQVKLFRSKTSRGKVSAYYTFISEDAKLLVKQWLRTRPQSTEYPNHLFLTFRKVDGKWVPVTPAQIGSNVTAVAKKAGLITNNGANSSANRYHIHAHEFRDLFKSVCQLNGVKPVASEYFLGHSIDKLGYDKSPEYDLEFFRKEYRKVEPFLNVISNPQAFGKQENLKLEFKKELLLTSGYTEQEVEDMNIGSISDEQLRGRIREKLLGAMVNNGSKQKVVATKDIEKYLHQGYEFVASLPNRKAIIRIPS
jgi:integrase